VMLFKFIFVLSRFDTEKDEAEKHGDREHADEQSSTRRLRGPDGEDDGQAAADEYSRVGCAERCINRFAGRPEVSEIPPPVNQVGAEKATKKHDFRAEEDPHSQTGGIALLLRFSKVMQQCGIVRRVSFAMMVVDRG